jgi:hypothetical protein
MNVQQFVKCCFSKVIWSDIYTLGNQVAPLLTSAYEES